MMKTIEIEYNKWRKNLKFNILKSSAIIKK
jgi:hypothetical protein